MPPRTLIHDRLQAGGRLIESAVKPSRRYTKARSDRGDLAGLGTNRTRAKSQRQYLGVTLRLSRRVVRGVNRAGSRYVVELRSPTPPPAEEAQQG